MSSNAQVGISNKMSDGISPNKAFDMALVTADPVLTAGTVQVNDISALPPCRT
jgi:hypothetical protein